ncbi:MAG: NAD-dependent epimerase/dehydratase family protein, partial [Planctomycetes bacterium]|nr:NAD-dependent epimerase/dehydratase family protein [Planctomycetota bacterium]
GLESVGLRYFNVLGARQDPNGTYAAVIPRWFFEFQRGVRPTIFGDGETTRDFCPVEDIVQANLLAATAPPEACGEVYNVALGRSTPLNQLYSMIRDLVAADGVDCAGWEPDFGPFRAGDVRHSRADIARAWTMLGFRPSEDITGALRRARPPVLG